MAERKGILHDDGLLYCQECGEPMEAYVFSPAFDGTGRKIKRKVTVMCRCASEKLRRHEEEVEFRKKQESIDRLRKLSLIDSKLKNATFKQYTVDESNERAFRIAKRYAENFKTMQTKGQGLMFYGEVGTGKSYTAAAIANFLIDELHPVIMTSLTKLLDKSNGYGKDDESFISASRNADLVILDDFGAERNTTFATEKIYTVIDEIYRTSKPLIITTNISLEEMTSCEDTRYKRIYDRIFSMCFPVMMEGMSWRKREAASSYEETKRLLEG